MGIVERPLMLKKAVMHLPEFLLGEGRFCGFCGMLGMRVDLGQGKMTKDKAQPIPQPELYLLDNGVRFSTRRTLKITIFHQCHQGMFWSPLMIALPKWQREPGCL